jgi:hypothetical protein
VTDSVLVVGSPSTRVRVAYIFAMADTAMTVTIETKGSDQDHVLWKAYLAANSGFAARAPEQQWLTSTEEGDSLVISTSAEGNCFVSILFRYDT